MARVGEPLVASTVGLAARLSEAGRAVSPAVVASLLRSLERDGQGLADQDASLDLRHLDRDRRELRLRRPWSEVTRLGRLRRAAAERVLGALVEKARAKGERGASVLVPFEVGELVRALEGELRLVGAVRSGPALVDQTLLFLHDHRVLTLQGGLSVFRRAYTLRREPDAPSGVRKEDMKPLLLHQEQRTLQIHVAGAYAARGAEDGDEARELARDWFRMPQDRFVARWFPGRAAALARPTSEASYQGIVGGLDLEQRDVVTAPEDENLLVIAGPGAGKTRVLVHRVAWLVRVKRVRPSGILVVCYTRANAIELRRRLRELLDVEAHGVVVNTLHGLALRLTGARPTDGDLDRVLEQATAVLRGEAAAGEGGGGEPRDGGAGERGGGEAAQGEGGAWEPEFPTRGSAAGILANLFASGGGPDRGAERSEGPGAASEASDAQKQRAEPGGHARIGEPEFPTRGSAAGILANLFASGGGPDRGAERSEGPGAASGASDAQKQRAEPGGHARLGDPRRAAEEARELALRGATHLLVDEYQDLDEKQAALVEAIAGREVRDREGRLTRLAVGDDDQAIFGWRGGSPRWLGRFEAEWGARRVALRRCYRCAPAVLAAAERVIAPVRGRLKEGVGIEAVTRGEAGEAAESGEARGVRGEAAQGGSGEAARGASGEAVRRWEVGPGELGPVVAALLEGAGPDVTVLARSRSVLAEVRAALEAEGREVSWPLRHEDSLPLAQVREVARVLDQLEAWGAEEPGGARLDGLVADGAGPWTELLRRWREELLHAEGDVVNAAVARRALWELLATERGERRVGGGVRLGTLHGAKGLEWERVILVDNGREPLDDDSRRLWYVGITRAKRRVDLVVPRRGGSALLQGVGVPQDPLPVRPLARGRHYELIGLRDVWLDWLAREPAAPGLEVLARLPVGSEVQLARSGRRASLHADGAVIGWLTVEATERWAPRRPSLRLVAVLRRDAAQVEPEHRAALHRETWWVPVCEGSWEDPLTGSGTGARL